MAGGGCLFFFLLPLFFFFVLFYLLLLPLLFFFSFFSSPSALYKYNSWNGERSLHWCKNSVFDCILSRFAGACRGISHVIQRTPVIIISHNTCLAYCCCPHHVKYFVTITRTFYTEVEAVNPQLDVRFTSQHAGFVTTKHQKSRETLCDLLTLPKGHMIVVSFDLRYTDSELHEELVSMTVDDNLVTKYSTSNFKVNLFKGSSLDMCVGVTVKKRRSCFKMLFSFHPENNVPQRLSSGLFNCSTEDYRRFKPHLDCNLKVECEDGRDETDHRPYSSPACQGWVAAHHKCYRLFSSPSKITGVRARDTCRTLGFELATVKTELEANSVFTLLWGLRARALFGLTCSARSQPFMYRWFLMWSDNTAIYNANHLPLWCFDCWEDEYCVFQVYDSRLYTDIYAREYHFVCEKCVQQYDVFMPPSIDLLPGPTPPFISKQTSPTLVVCIEGHGTHAFLSCDRESRCGLATCYFIRQTRLISEAPSAAQHSADAVAMYSCSSDDIVVSYSLLCDFRQDCADNSDESFCFHLPCTGFACTNGHCVSLNKHCNNLVDCLDGSDEKNCPRNEDEEDSIADGMSENRNQNNSFVVNLDGRGYFSQRVINLTDPCPGTHYRCTKEWFYCLPIYTRCNRTSDCVFQEDERDCEDWTCPGLFRCRGSSVCVHADHMCVTAGPSVHSVTTSGCVT